MEISVSHRSVSQPFLCNTRRFIKTLWLTNTLPEKCDYNSDNRNGDRFEDRALFLVREAWGNVVSYEGDDSQVEVTRNKLWNTVKHYGKRRSAALSWCGTQRCEGVRVVPLRPVCGDGRLS